jgi:hypothetical protein
MHTGLLQCSIMLAKHLPLCDVVRSVALVGLFGIMFSMHGRIEYLPVVFSFAQQCQAQLQTPVVS